MPPAKKQSVEINFPLQGVVEGTSHSTQPPNTTSDAKNVMPFDVDEDRARGGRREGIVKSTDAAGTNEKIDFIGDVRAENTTTVKAVGGVSKFDDDHALYPQHEGKIYLNNINDDQEPTETQLGGNLGHPWFCRSTTGMTWNKTATSNNWNSSWMSGYARTIGVSPLYETVNYGSNDPSYAKSLRMLGHNSGVIKKTTDGVPYLSLRPHMCPVHAGCNEAGEPDNKHSWGEWIGTFEQGSAAPSGLANTTLSSMMGTYDKSIEFKKMISLMPLTEFDQHPWNSDQDKAYATNLKFKAPIGYTKVNGGVWSDSTFMTFVKSSADEDVNDPSKI